jgi:hypothetical protein
MVEPDGDTAQGRGESLSESSAARPAFLETLEQRKHPTDVRHLASMPAKAQQALLQDAASRDRTTARRACLVRILCFERYLTRTGLIARVERELGRGCFGLSHQTKHLRDITGIVLTLGDELDTVYIETWAERKGLSTLWNEILARIRS